MTFSFTRLHSFFNGVNHFSIFPRFSRTKYLKIVEALTRHTHTSRSFQKTVKSQDLTPSERIIISGNVYTVTFFLDHYCQYTGNISSSFFTGNSESEAAESLDHGWMVPTRVVIYLAYSNIEQHNRLFSVFRKQCEIL